MGLFDLFRKNQSNTEKVSELKSGEFGILCKAFCTPIKSIETICVTLDCPAHFAFTPVFNQDPTANYPVYTLKILAGEINAGDNSEMLGYIFSKGDQECVELLHKRFNLNETEARNLFLCGIQYTFNDLTNSVEFFSENVLSYLKASDVRYHLRALSEILQGEIPNAYVKPDNRMIFVMLNGNA